MKVDEAGCVGRYDRQSEKRRIGRSTQQHVIGIAVSLSSGGSVDHIPQNIQQQPAAMMTPIMKKAKSALAPAS
jgi:hypothetical protein